MAGLALIVANDAAVNSKVITTGREVEAVFKEVLKFETELLVNETKEEIISHLSTLEKYPSGMKMVFYFVGHGSEDQIFVKDGNITISKDILDKFQPSRAPSICEIPKLFFFDCCRGNAPVGAAPPQAMGKPVPLVHPAKGNMLVAYSTHYSYVSFDVPHTSGPIWSNYLKEELGRDHSIYDALQITNAKLMREYNINKDYWKGHNAFQAPTFESSLTGGTIINLRREADQLMTPPARGGQPAPLGQPLHGENLALDMNTLKNLPQPNGNTSINITQRILDYNSFGNSILNDGYGTITRGLEDQYQRDAPRIVCEILTKWLGGEGRPATWVTLITVLTNMKKKPLAEQIRAALSM